MKILVVSSVFPRFKEDSEVPWLRYSLNELKKENEVLVLAPAYKGLKSHTIDGISVKRFRYAPAFLEILTHDEGAPSKMANKPWLQLLAIPYILNGILQCFLLCKKEKPDIIHAHWPFPHGLIALFASKIFKIPLVLNFHGAELLLVKKKPWIKYFLKFVIWQATGIFANSSFTAKKIQAIKKCNVIISPYGTTLERTPSENIHEVKGKFKILFVGRHIERKGITYLIKAATLLPKDKFEIRIAGTGDLTENLKEETENYNLENVLFLGKLSKEKLQEEYQNANAFTLPAIIDKKGDTEGLGVVLIEAAENNLPIVASHVGGISDVIIHNKTGILVKQKSEKELAKAFLELEKNPEFAKELVQNAHAHIRKYFSWDSIIKAQTEAYKSFISQIS